MRGRNSPGRLAVIWSSSAELFEALSGALGVAGYTPVVPGARSAEKMCSVADLVVLDSRDAGYAPPACSSGALVVDGGDVLGSVFAVLAATGQREALVGIDPGASVTGYAVLSGSSLVYGGHLPGDPRVVASATCGAASRYAVSGAGRLLVGVGASPSVSSAAEEIACRLRGCGIEAVLVDETGSNHASLGLLSGAGRALSVHVRAAAAIALRAYMRWARL